MGDAPATGTTEVAVVGGGLAGLTAAAFAARSGASVRLLDAARASAVAAGRPSMPGSTSTRARTVRDTVYGAGRAAWPSWASPPGAKCPRC